MGALAEDAPDALTEAFRELPRRLRASALAGIKRIAADLSDHARAVDLLKHL